MLKDVVGLYRLRSQRRGVRYDHGACIWMSNRLGEHMGRIQDKLIWLAVAIAGAIAFGILALSRGEHVNAVWIVVAAVACYAISYRFYSRFIANKVFELDDSRKTPAERRNDGLDYVPTNKYVLFGHHFAAIAGAGPLVGPILAAQMGYLPGTLWILIGVMLAGAVQDFLVLFMSTRRDGRSLGEMAKQELGPFAGVVVMLGALGVMIIILSALALVVVKALADIRGAHLPLRPPSRLRCLWAFICAISGPAGLPKFRSSVLC